MGAVREHGVRAGGLGRGVLSIPFIHGFFEALIPRASGDLRLAFKVGEDWRMGTRTGEDRFRVLQHPENSVLVTEQGDYDPLGKAMSADGELIFAREVEQAALGEGTHLATLFVSLEFDPSRTRWTIQFQVWIDGDPQVLLLAQASELPSSFWPELRFYGAPDLELWAPSYYFMPSDAH